MTLAYFHDHPNHEEEREKREKERQAARMKHERVEKEA